MSKTNDAPPNQSLKLTEPAVDDLHARNNQSHHRTGLSSRGLDSVAAALRCRSLAPGPLGAIQSCYKENNSRG